MKTKRVILLFSAVCVVMLLNISITQRGIHKLDFKICSLKEAQATEPDENSYNKWYLGGTEDPRWDWFGWTNCYRRFGWFDDAVYCPNAPH